MTREDLSALMHGVSPRDGHELRRAGGDGSRVAGIDMTFSAPKSVSALWAVSSPYERARIEAAHSKAVAGAIARTEREVALVRTRSDGKLHWERASSLLAAEFVHTSSRLTRDQESGGVPDPQLHSHVVVLGAERANGRFAAVDSRELFRGARQRRVVSRRARRGPGRARPSDPSATGRDGRYFEVAGVPEKLSERWSMRGVEIERAARAFSHSLRARPARRRAGLVDGGHARHEGAAEGRRGRSRMEGRRRGARPLARASAAPLRKPRARTVLTRALRKSVGPRAHEEQCDGQ